MQFNSLRSVCREKTRMLPSKETVGASKVHMVKELGWITSVPVGIPVCLLGLLGNIISICVWLRFIRKKIGSSQSSSIYFIVLGVIDSGLLFFFLMTDSLPAAIGKSMEHSYGFNWFYCYVGFPVFFFCIVASIWLTVGVAVNRLIMVRFPVQARRHCTPTRTYIAIACILAFCFIINMPHFFNYVPEKITDSQRNFKDHYGYKKTAYSERGSAVQYEFWVHCMFLVLVPWGSIAVLNAWIISTLMYNTKAFNELSNNDDKVTERQKQDRQITKVLLTVTFAFLILLAWQCVNQCFFMLEFGKNKSVHNWMLVQETYQFARLGVILNSAINCLLYCFSGSTFRKELRRLVRLEDDSTTRPSLTPMNT